jgi:hypothetical protein
MGAARAAILRITLTLAISALSAVDAWAVGCSSTACPAVHGRYWQSGGWISLGGWKVWSEGKQYRVSRTERHCFSSKNLGFISDPGAKVRAAAPPPCSIRAAVTYRHTSRLAWPCLSRVATYLCCASCRSSVLPPRQSANPCCCCHQPGHATLLRRIARIDIVLQPSVICASWTVSWRGSAALPAAAAAAKSAESKAIHRRCHTRFTTSVIQADACPLLPAQIVTTHAQPHKPSGVPLCMHAAGGFRELRSMCILLSCPHTHAIFLHLAIGCNCSSGRQEASKHCNKLLVLLDVGLMHAV